MTELTTGRTLDRDGRPVPGTGFEFDPDGRVGERIRERTGPITSHPSRPVWGIPLDGPEDTIRTLSVFGAGYGGPPPHYHERSREQFAVKEGALTLTRDGSEDRLSAGEAATIETGVTHSFRNHTDERALVVTRIESPGRLRQVLPTLGGLAHDDERDPENPLQQSIIGARLAGNTVFTEQNALAPVSTLLAPVAKVAGYQGAYGKYTQPAFWERHVEQPDI